MRWTRPSTIAFAVILGACVTSPQSATSGGEVVSGLRVLSSNDFRSPENVVYDAADDVYLVSNINGDPNARDGNGFISRIAPDGSVLALKWIDGTKSGVSLDAPKGLAIRGDTLFVADIGAVRMFDRRSGAPLGNLPMPGKALNDIAFERNGTMYVTDTGPDRTSTPVDTSRDVDAVFGVQMPQERPWSVARGLQLDRPDGIVATDSGLYFTTFGSNKIERITRDGARRNVVATLPGGKVDGLRALPDGSLLVTSWDARSVFRFLPGHELRVIASGIQSPAGVAFDAKRHRVVITSMQGNHVMFAPLE